MRILLLVVIICIVKQGQASCEFQIGNVCDETGSAIEYFDDLNQSLYNHLSSCKGNCEKFKAELDRVNSCKSQVIQAHNTQCSNGFPVSINDTDDEEKRPTRGLASVED